MPVKFHRIWCFHTTDFDPAVIMDSTSHSKASEEQGAPTEYLQKECSEFKFFTDSLVTNIRCNKDQKF